MRKLRIFIDSDEVLMKFTQPILDKYNNFYNKNLTLEDITSWELNDCIEEGTDIYQFMDEKGFFETLEPYDDSIKVLKKLIEDGHDVFIATAGWKEIYNDKLISFAKHFPFLNEHQILLIKRKDVLYGDVLLDDGLHNIERSICKHPIIMDRPWNRNSNNKRVYSLTEFYEKINEIANKSENN